jgi:hypothetical protein
MLLAFLTSVTLSQAAEPTAPVPSQEKVVKKGDPGQVQEQTVSLTQAVHFTDAKGQDVVVGPGNYRVEAEGTNRIHLLPTGTGKAVVIDAVSFTHQQPVENPVPVTTPDPQQPDVLNLALLLPGGQGVGAVGAYSGVKPRAVTNWAALALGASLYQPAPVVRDHRTSPGLYQVPVAPGAPAPIVRDHRTPSRVIYATTSIKCGKTTYEVSTGTKTGSCSTQTPMKGGTAVGANCSTDLGSDKASATCAGGCGPSSGAGSCTIKTAQ